jgi:hypothetical protein
VTHGSVQLVIGPLADRFGKYRIVIDRGGARPLFLATAVGLPILAL